MKVFNVIHYYLLAFSNKFDYKSIAVRKELNNFILTVILTVMLILFLVIVFCLSFANKNLINFLLFFKILFISGVIYFLIHLVPLISLVKRRFNKISKSKANICFGIWCSLVILELLINIVLFTLIMSNPFTDMSSQIGTLPLPLILLGQVSGFIIILTVLFLMIKE